MKLCKVREYSLPLFTGILIAMIMVNVNSDFYYEVIYKPLIAGTNMTLHFFVNECFMVLFFGMASAELVRSFREGGDLYPVKKAINGSGGGGGHDPAGVGAAQSGQRRVLLVPGGVGGDERGGVGVGPGGGGGVDEPAPRRGGVGLGLDRAVPAAAERGVGVGGRDHGSGDERRHVLLPAVGCGRVGVDERGRGGAEGAGLPVPGRVRPVGAGGAVGGVGPVGGVVPGR